jgi:hypothetical protein
MSDQAVGRPRLTRAGGRYVADPTRMCSSQLHDSYFGSRRHLVWTGGGLRCPVSKTCDPVGGISAQPLMNRLADHPVPEGNVCHRCTVEHFAHCPVTLFHQSQLHQCHNGLLLFCERERSQRRRSQPADGGPSGTKCRAGTGATVSSMYRDRTLHVADAGRRFRVYVSGRRGLIELLNAQSI